MFCFRSSWLTWPQKHKTQRSSFCQTFISCRVGPRASTRKDWRGESWSAVGSLILLVWGPRTARSLFLFSPTRGRSHPPTHPCTCILPAGSPSEPFEEQETHIRASSAFDSPETLGGFVDFVRQAGSRLDAHAVLSVVPRGLVAYPQVRRRKRRKGKGRGREEGRRGGGGGEGNEWTERRGREEGKWGGRAIPLPLSLLPILVPPFLYPGLLAMSADLEQAGLALRPLGRRVCAAGGEGAPTAEKAVVCAR